MTATTAANRPRTAAPPQSGRSPSAFVHQSLCTRVVMRPGAVQDLPVEIDKLGCRRPLLLSGTRTGASQLYADARQGVSRFAWAEASDIPPHSSVACVKRITELADKHEADVLVAVGGGSVVDTAKAAALLLAEGGPLERHASRFEPPDTVITPPLPRRKLPIVSLPTTASGAEVTGSIGVRTPDGGKLLFTDVQLASRVILLDPRANLEVPPQVLLPTAMNGLAHCIEGLYSKNRSPISDELALSGLALFARAMREVSRSPRSVDARADLLAAAHISGMVLASARSCLHHALCHVLGASFSVPHGAVNSVMLPWSVRFNAGSAAQELAAAARRLDLAQAADEAPQALVEWIGQLQQDTGVPTRLRDLGIERKDLKAVAAKALHERGLAFNPRPVSDAAELEQLLEAAW